MALIRYGCWTLIVCSLAGCRTLTGDGAFLAGRKANQTPTKSEKDKTDYSFRINGSQQPDLFPAELLTQDNRSRPTPDFKKEDIHPTGGVAQPTLPRIDPPPSFPSDPPSLPPPAVIEGFPGIADLPAEKREPVVEALHCILNGKHNEALTHLRNYDQSTQELFLRLLPPVAQLSRKSLDRLAPAEVAVLHEQLQSLVTTLRPRTELTIDCMCFCEWVKGYGVYRPLGKEHVFQASTPHRPGDLVQLYVELRNVASELRGGYFETRLTSTVEIHDARGEKKWPLRFDEKEPFRTRTLLNDFFNVYSFHVPDLPPGTYNLTVQIADETRPELRRQTRRSLEFRVTTAAR